MLYYLFNYLDTLDFPCGYVSICNVPVCYGCCIFSLIGIFVGKRIIDKLQRKQIGETIRNLDLEGQYSRAVHPLWRIIIILSILVSTLLLVSWKIYTSS